MTRSRRTRAALATAFLAAAIGGGVVSPAIANAASAPHASRVTAIVSPQGIEGTGKSGTVVPDGIQGTGK
ncbi:hypothetical protein ABIA35_002214 [Catenulispora sp. MAP12-49]|uniref:hypothetical protein n=1 Tax=Catenulispora sp. MAP12-49 TaxID=3156302 RepID=UPI0035181649